MLSAFLRGLGAVLSLLSTASFLSLDITGALDRPDSEYPWQWWALGAFLMFVSFVVWYVGALEWQLHKIKTARPSVHLVPSGDESSLLCDLQNTGAVGGHFAVRFTVNEGGVETIGRRGVWQDTNQP